MLYALKEVFDAFIEYTLEIRITSWATIKRCPNAGKWLGIGSSHVIYKYNPPDIDLTQIALELYARFSMRDMWSFLDDYGLPERAPYNFRYHF
jgi:hypothetical protein